MFPMQVGWVGVAPASVPPKDEALHLGNEIRGLPTWWSLPDSISGLQLPPGSFWRPLLIPLAMQAASTILPPGHFLKNMRANQRPK